MTIEELLALAQKHIDRAGQTTPISLSERAVSAQIALAATTAQAMILHTACSKGTDANGVPSYWLRTDGGYS